MEGGGGEGGEGGWEEREARREETEEEKAGGREVGGEGEKQAETVCVAESATCMACRMSDVWVVGGMVLTRERNRDTNDITRVRASFIAGRDGIEAWSRVSSDCSVVTVWVMGGCGVADIVVACNVERGTWSGTNNEQRATVQRESSIWFVRFRRPGGMHDGV